MAVVVLVVTPALRRETIEDNPEQVHRRMLSAGLLFLLLAVVLYLVPVGREMYGKYIEAENAKAAVAKARAEEAAAKMRHGMAINLAEMSKAGLVKVFVDVVHAIRVEAGGSALETVDFVSLG